MTTTSTDRLLAAARAAQATARAAEVDLAVTTAQWARVHAEPAASPHGLPYEGIGGIEGVDQALELAGPGAHGVSEFALVEYAANLGLSTDAGRGYVGDIVELAERLPLLWARVTAGQVPVWQARRVAQATRGLGLEGAGFVDRQVNTVAGRIGPAALDRLVGEAMVRYEPDRAEDQRIAAEETRHLTIDLHATPLPGTLCSTVHLEGTLDHADARDLEHTIARLAGQLAALGSTDPLGVRRAAALGELARHQNSLDLTTAHDDAAGDSEDAAVGSVPAREVVLHVHLTADGATGGETGIPLARVEGTNGPFALDTIAAWCTTSHTRVTIKPVIDLAAAHHTSAYEIPDRLRQQTILIHPTCVFPWCTRPSRRADLDHINPFEQGGQTSSGNLAPLCRRHHRVKTHGHWTYTPPDPLTNPLADPGVFIWTSPHGHRYLRTPHGTTRLD